VSVENVPAQSWYSVRCLFFHPPNTYEERITAWQTPSFSQAFELAEADAQDYADATGSRYCELAQAYWLYDIPGHGAEVFSLMRDSSLGEEEYLDRFFATGAERERDFNDRRLPPAAHD
jgi:hypothetical protein